MRSSSHALRALLAALCALLIAGCSSVIDSSKLKRDYVESYASGNFEEAAKLSAEKAEDRAWTGDALMWSLEAGKCEFSRGAYKASLAELSAAERKVEDFEGRPTVNAREILYEGASAATNQNVLPFDGSYVDRELLNAYKALDYFALGKPEDALVELRRMHERQKKAVEARDAEIKAAGEAAAKERFNAEAIISSSPELKGSAHAGNAALANSMNPFCSYLSAIGYLWRGNYDEALVDLRNLHEMDPGNQLFSRDLVSVSTLARTSPPDDLKGLAPHPYPLSGKVVFILAESGMAASKKATTIHLFLPPPVGYTGFAFPVLEYSPKAISSVEWSDNFGSSGGSVRIADMDAIIAQEYRGSLVPMIVRTVISVLVKEGASAVAVEAARNSKNNVAWIFTLLGTSLYKFLFNTADTRCWQTLPKEFLACHMPMPSDGVVRLGYDGGPVRRILQLDAAKKMAIVYVQSTRHGVFSVKVFQFD